MRCRVQLLVLALAVLLGAACDSGPDEAPAPGPEWERIAALRVDSQESLEAQRDQAIAAVERQQDDPATLIPAFLAVKDRLHPDLQRYVIELLKSKLSEAGPDGVAVLGELIDSGDPRLRTYGIVTVVALFRSTEGAREAFVEMLYGDDDALSMAAIGAVAGLASVDLEGAFAIFDAAALPAGVTEQSRAKRNTRRRAQLLYVIEWAHRLDPEVRSRVARLGRGLGLDVRDQVVLHVELLTAHPTEAIRAQAASALASVAGSFDRGLFDFDAFVGVLDRVYEHDPSPLVKVMAVNVLVELGVDLPRQAERLRARLTDLHRAARFNAARTIWKTGPARLDAATVVDAVCELGSFYHEMSADPSQRSFATEARVLLDAAAASDVEAIREAAQAALAGGCDSTYEE